MARALRRVSVERGIDPRGCVLVAFGGGGPLHGCGLAERVGVERVLVPPFAGVLSALGLALAAERRESMASVMQPLGALEPSELRATLHALRARTGAEGAGSAQWWLRARYAGQGHELDVPVAVDEHPSRIGSRFADLHGARFGFTLERPVEIVSARCAVTGSARPVQLRDGLASPSVIHGPATATLADATMLVKGGWVARSLEMGGWLLEREGE
jgi:N-methylhydantoinase A